MKLTFHAQLVLRLRLPTAVSGLRQPGSEADISRATSAKAKTANSCVSPPPPYAFVSWCLIEHRTTVFDSHVSRSAGEMWRRVMKIGEQFATRVGEFTLIL